MSRQYLRIDFACGYKLDSVGLEDLSLLPNNFIGVSKAEATVEAERVRILGYKDELEMVKAKVRRHCLVAGLWRLRFFLDCVSGVLCCDGRLGIMSRVKEEMDVTRR